MSDDVEISAPTTDKLSKTGNTMSGAPLIDPQLFDSAEFRKNPYPYYRILRDHYPVYWDKLHNRYLITRYKDVTDAYLDDDSYNTITKGSSNLVNGNTFLELGGREHTRRRKIFGNHLTGKHLEARLPAIRRLALDMLTAAMAPAAQKMLMQEVHHGQVFDLGADFADEFPIRVIGEVLGFPDDARKHFYYWYYTIQQGLKGGDKAKRALVARKELEDYVCDLIVQRREEPTFLYDEDQQVVGSDVISQLVHAKINGVLLSAPEIISMISVLVTGGGDTTRGAILHMWRLLLEHPDQFAAVQDDPELFNSAFHETMRHSSPVGGMSRSTNREITLHGTTIPKGAWVELVNFSANHDESIFPNPDSFNIFRPELYVGKEVQRGFRMDDKYSHVGFGAGSHFCPGAWIAHQETVIASQVILSRFKNPQLLRNSMTLNSEGELEPMYVDRLSEMRELWISYD